MTEGVVLYFLVLIIYCQTLLGFFFSWKEVEVNIHKYLWKYYVEYLCN